MTSVREDLGPDAPSGTTPDHRYGAPVALWRALERRRPPLPLFRADVWRSPLRGQWFTAVLALVLLVGLPLVTFTGFMSYAAYEPRFPGNAFPADPGFLRLPYFAWPASPSWLFRLNQGVHVGLGLVLVPIVLAKLWSVIPKLFEWPPSRSVAQLVERLSLALLVGGILFEISTGVMNIQYDYAFGFDFYAGHYYGAWLFLAAFAAHIVIKWPAMVRGLRSRSLREELRTDLAHTEPEAQDEHGLAPVDPAPPTISRRGALGVVAGASALIGGVTLGQTVGWRSTALLAPRGQSYGDGPNDFQVNRTAEAAGIEVPTDYAVTVVGPTTLRLTRAELLALPQTTAELPIACVEGWSTVQTWTGVRLRDLAAMAGLPEPSSAEVLSLERGGAFRRAVLGNQHVTHPDSLLALQVNGVDLSLDHGFPARVIAPSLPGVHNTKWVEQIVLRA